MNARTRLFAFVSIVLLFALLPIFASAADDTPVTIGEGKTEVTAADTADFRNDSCIPPDHMVKYMIRLFPQI